MAAGMLAGCRGGSRPPVERITGQPAVMGITFPNDVNSDRCLNLTELPTDALVAAIATAGLEDGQPVVVKDASSGKVYGKGTAKGNKANVTLSMLPLTASIEADFPLVVEVTALSGRTNNTGPGTSSNPRNDAAFVSLRVDRVAPSITVTSPASNSANLALTDDADTSTPGFQFRLVLTTASDVGHNGVQFVANPGGGTTTSAPSNGTVIQDFTLSAAGTGTTTFASTATDNCGNVGPTQNVTVTLPTFVTGAQATGNDGDTTGFLPASTLNVVTSPNVNLVPGTPHPGYVLNKGTGTNPAADLSFTVINAIGAQAVPVFNGSPIGAPQNITSSPQTLTFTGVPLAQAPTAKLGVRVYTLSGASAEYTIDATVDVVPPAQTMNAPALVNTGQFSERAPALNLSWPSSGDDGTTGMATSYEVRWSTDAVIGSGLVTDALYFDPTKFKKASSTLLPASATSFQLTGLPTIGTYYVQVRALDKVGNYAPLSNSGTLDHQLNVVTINNPNTTGNFGFFMRSNGDLNGDGNDDLVISSNGNPRSVWIAYGSTNMSTFAASPTLVPIPASSFATSVFDFSIGNASHATGSTPALKDLLVADPTWNTNRGRYLLFFGQPGRTTINTTPVEFRGLAANSNNGAGSGSVSDVGYVKILPDFGSPTGGGLDGFDEILISATGENGNNGHVYLFYGRSQASWQALATANDGPGLDPGINYIPLSAADRIFSGEAPPTCMRCASTPNPAGSFFGVRRGYTSLGDLDGKGVPYFAIPDARDFVNKLYIFSGDRVNKGGPSATLPQIAPTDAFQILAVQEPQAPFVPGGTWRGFGSDAIGNLPLTGATAKDLVVGYPAIQTVSVYSGATPTGFQKPPLLITGGGRFGNTLAVGDINGDGRPDLIVGTNNCATCPGGFAPNAWILYNTGVAGAEFDTQWQQFNQSRLAKDPADSTAPNAIGISVAVGDFNGDGKPDVAVADNLATAPQGSGKIFVRY